MKYLLLLFMIFFLSATLAQTVDSIAIKQVDSLLQVSRTLTGQREYDQALEINTTAERIALEKLGRESAAYGKCTFNRGRVNQIKQDYPEAEKWYLEALDIRENVLGKEHPDYAASLNNLATLYQNTGQYEKAESRYLEAREIFEDSLNNTEHPSYLIGLNGQAVLYMNQGKYEEAEPLYLKAIAVKEKTGAEDDADYATYLQNLGNLYLVMGHYDQVESLYLRSMAIREKVLGDDHPEYAKSLNNLGNFYYKLDNFEKAEPLYIKAKSIREKIGRDNIEYCGSLINLANLYADMGSYEKAVQEYLEAIDIFEQRLNNRVHPFYLIGLQNLGLIYQRMGHSKKAEPIYLEVRDIRDKVLGVSHPAFAKSLNSLALFYQETGQYDKAETFHLQARDIRENALGKEHEDYTESINNLGNLYNLMGQFDRAERLYIESKSIKEKVLGKQNRNYINCLANLANVYEKQYRFPESDGLLAELFPLLQGLLIKSVLFLSERELAAYNTTFKSYENILESYMIHRKRMPAFHQQDALPSIVYDHILFQKGFVLGAAARLNIVSASTTLTRETSLRLKGYRQRLAREYSRPKAEQKNIRELEEKANHAEKDLARSIASYAESIQQVKWQDVQARLKPTEAAIEFIHFQVNFPSTTDSIIYAALLVLPGAVQPEFIPLFEEKSLASLVQSTTDRKADYVNELYTLADRGLVKLGTEKSSLYELIWKPLEAELSGVKTIYFSPSGLLHRINIDAIPVSEMETIADKYQLISLNSTRQIVIPSALENINKYAILFGGIQFEQDSTIQNNEPLLASRSIGDFSFTSVDSTLRGGTWNYLAGTEREVNAIEKIMQTSGINTTLKKGNTATEEAFKNIGANNAASPRILHIATHGYFFPDPKSNAKSSGLSDEQESVFKISDHPMLRSGLILAGGNAAWQGNQTLEGREDGILTAYEISQMNLSNTELVVLSACETGLGEIQGNEGVYGLQRAFKIAGAKYLIMSLWQVPDKQTSLLMTTFYKNWLHSDAEALVGKEGKMTIPEAFHAAQKQLRENGLDPYNWAGFVLVE